MINAGFSVSNQWHTFPESSVRVQGLEVSNIQVSTVFCRDGWDCSSDRPLKRKKARKKRFRKVDWSTVLYVARWTWSYWGSSWISWCSKWNAWSSSGMPQLVQLKSSSTIRVTYLEFIYIDLSIDLSILFIKKLNWFKLWQQVMNWFKDLSSAQLCSTEALSPLCSWCCWCNDWHWRGMFVSKNSDAAIWFLFRWTLQIF